MNYLIIGGVAGGATVAARLRRMDEKARSEGEAHLPFVVFVDVAADITFILYGCDHFRNA